ncbi:MAG: phosphate-starvation-inducible PsiE family protein, partial [Bacteroidota bacterium]
VFDKAHEIKIRIIIIVCLIAVSRKVLVMDTHKSDPLSDLAIAALILAFSLSYFLVKKNEKLSESK